MGVKSEHLHVRVDQKTAGKIDYFVRTNYTSHSSFLRDAIKDKIEQLEKLEEEYESKAGKRKSFS